MESYITFVKELVAKGGPEPADYDDIDKWLNQVARDVKRGELTKNDVQELQHAFGSALTDLRTLQGLSYQKPRGYAGDFEMIDRIYQKSYCPNATLIRWDRYYHATPAARAVRNRKKYFKDLMHNLEATVPGDGPIHVLNVASGPARDVFEFLSGEHKGRIRFDCIDNDAEAITYSSIVCQEFAHQTNFIRTNAFRYRSERPYHLIWSAGLFDYLDERRFTFLIRRLYPMLAPGAEMVVGNFSEENPTRNFCEVMLDWFLIHRSPEEMRRLALLCGIPEALVRVDAEPEGINLFLHMQQAG